VPEVGFSDESLQQLVKAKAGAGGGAGRRGKKGNRLGSAMMGEKATANNAADVVGGLLGSSKDKTSVVSNDVAVSGGFAVPSDGRKSSPESVRITGTSSGSSTSTSTSGSRSGTSISGSNSGASTKSAVSSWVPGREGSFLKFKVAAEQASAEFVSSTAATSKGSAGTSSSKVRRWILTLIMKVPLFAYLLAVICLVIFMSRFSSLLIRALSFVVCI
jgi:cobalamin biosynthesis Mg chelatase CobN